MIVAEIDVLGWGHCLSTTHQVVLHDDPPIRLPPDGCPGRGGKRPHDAAAVEARDARKGWLMTRRSPRGVPSRTPRPASVRPRGDHAARAGIGSCGGRGFRRGGSASTRPT